MKSLWSRGHLRCSLPSTAVAFRQLTASSEHQSLFLMVLCMKYYDFDSIILFVVVCALAPLGFFDWLSSQKRVNLPGWEWRGSSEMAAWWSVQDRAPSQALFRGVDSCGGEYLVGINPSGLWLGPATVTGGDHCEEGLFVTVTSHM